MPIDVSPDGLQLDEAKAPATVTIPLVAETVIPEPEPRESVPIVPRFNCPNNVVVPLASLRPDAVPPLHVPPLDVRSDAVPVTFGTLSTPIADGVPKESVVEKSPPCAENLMLSCLNSENCVNPDSEKTMTEFVEPVEPKTKLLAFKDETPPMLKFDAFTVPETDINPALPVIVTAPVPVPITHAVPAVPFAMLMLALPVDRLYWPSAETARERNAVRKVFIG